MLWHIRRGRLAREQIFNDPAEALAGCPPSETPYSWRA
jgi:hypothetical protein